MRRDWPEIQHECHLDALNATTATHTSVNTAPGLLGTRQRRSWSTTRAMSTGYSEDSTAATPRLPREEA